MLKRTLVNRKGSSCTRRGYGTVVQQKNEEQVYNASRVRRIEVLNNREGEQWAVMRVVVTANINEIMNDIKLGTAVAVSDGSFKNEFGTGS